MNQEELNNVIRKHKLWIEGKEGGERANLSEADLYGADLRWVCLANADLRGANLECANLEGANLYKAELQGATLYGADLRWAGLTGAKMYQHMIDEASLTKRQRDSIIIVA